MSGVPPADPGSRKEGFHRRGERSPRAPRHPESARSPGRGHSSPAGLVDVPKGDGPFTVFAPTDEAFAKLPEGTVEALLADPEALRAILTYHVVPGKVMAGDVVELDRAQTVQGGYVQISTYGESVRINDATVITANIEASNGVIHVIDTVIPPDGPVTGGFGPRGRSPSRG